jgi:hypothetical protein
MLIFLKCLVDNKEGATNKPWITPGEAKVAKGIIDTMCMYIRTHHF